MSHARHTVLILLAVLVLFLVLAPHALFLFFASVLLAIAMRGLADPLARRLKIPDKLALLVVVLAVIGLFWLGGTLAAPQLADQTQKLVQQMPDTLKRLQDNLSHSGFGRTILGWVKPDQLAEQGQKAAQYLPTALFGTFGALSDFIFFLLIAVYLALDPAPYIRGFRALFAPSLHKRVDRTLNQVGHTLRGWLGGQLVAMVLIGVLSFLGLWMLGIPLAAVLAVLAALLTFIPVVGAFASGLPALLMALAQDPQTALWVLGLYFAIHIIEGDFVTPMVQKQAVDMPPATLLAAQFLMAALFGFMGLALAAPFTAMMLVVVRRGYVQAWVEGDDEEAEGSPALPAPNNPRLRAATGPAAGE